MYWWWLSLASYSIRVSKVCPTQCLKPCTYERTQLLHLLVTATCEAEKGRVLLFTVCMHVFMYVCIIHRFITYNLCIRIMHAHTHTHIYTYHMRSSIGKIDQVGRPYKHAYIHEHIHAHIYWIRFWIEQSEPKRHWRSASQTGRMTHISYGLVMPITSMVVLFSMYACSVNSVYTYDLMLVRSV